MRLRLFSILAFALPLAAQPTSSTLISGLSFPTKLLLTPGGNLLVTESGAAANSGRVSIVTKAGVRTTLLDGLPSGNAAPDYSPDGVNGLALSGNVLYIAIGEGDGHVNGTVSGTILPNPNGPSSPIFASVLKLTLPASVDQMAGPFSLKPQDHYTLLDGTAVQLTSAGGTTATVELVTANRVNIPDPRTIYRNSHPFGIALIPGSPDMLYMVDAGMNSLVQINTATGKAKTIVHFPAIPSGQAVPPVAEAVPDSIRTYGNGLLVTLLSGYPFNSYVSMVMYVDPSTGQTFPFIENLTSAIDIVWNTSTFFVLETSTNLGLANPAPGAILRYDTPAGSTWATGLVQPTSMALDSSSGSLYVSSRMGGSILRYPLQ